MENILYNISQVLGITILHSLWQGLFIYFALRFALMLGVKLSSSKKYLMTVASMIALAGWFIYTLVNEIQLYNWLSVLPEKLSAMPLMLQLPAGISHFNTESTRYYYNIERFLPYITVLYITGLLFTSTRLILARKNINSIKKSISIDIQLQLQLNKFVETFHIGKSVKIGLSKYVDVPCMVGYFKPLILLPFSLSTYLSAGEIEAIILHELAHIKRNDYLVNLLQQAMSVLLFFNPFAQLIDRAINRERENSCDDIVILATNKPLVYAHALLKLEQTRKHEWQLALAATGKKYHLLNRIERIMKTKQNIGNSRHILFAILLLCASITGLAWLNPTLANNKISINKIKSLNIAGLFIDTSSKKSVKAEKLATKKAIKAKRDKKVEKEQMDADLAKLSADIEKYGEALNAYYNSAEFKKYQDELEAKGKEIEEYYKLHEPDFKELELQQAKLGADFEKKWQDKGESREMAELGAKVGKYYDSPEFKRMNEQLEKKYGIVHKNYRDDRKDENYKKYEAELQSKVPAEVQEQTEQLKKMGEEIGKRYNSPEFLKKTEEMQLMADSMRKTFNNPEITQKQIEMKMLVDQVQHMQNNMDMKKIQEQLMEASMKLKLYMNSPEFKKHLKEMKDYNFDFKGDNWTGPEEKPEAPEKLEKPEAPEKVEKPEADEPVEPAAPAPVPPAPAEQKN